MPHTPQSRDEDHASVILPDGGVEDTLVEEQDKTQAGVLYTHLNGHRATITQRQFEGLGTEVARAQGAHVVYDNKQEGNNYAPSNAPATLQRGDNLRERHGDHAEEEDDREHLRGFDHLLGRIGEVVSKGYTENNIPDLQITYDEGAFFNRLSKNTSFLFVSLFYLYQPKLTEKFFKLSLLHYLTAEEEDLIKSYRKLSYKNQKFLKKIVNKENFYGYIVKKYLGDMNE